MSIEQGAIFKHDFGPRNDRLQEGPRPALVVQCDALNRLEGYENVIVVPLTTKQRGAATYVRLDPSTENGLEKVSWAITNQVFTISKSALTDRLGKLNKAELYAVKEGLKIALGIGA